MAKNDLFSILKSDNNTKFEVDNSENDKIKKYSPIEIVKSLFSEDIIDDNVINSTQYSQFMINRFLASTKYFKDFKYVQLAQSLNVLKLSNKMHYDYLFSELPKLDKVFPGYAWSKTEKSDIDKIEVIKALRWKYKYNERGAENAMFVIPQNELKELTNEYNNYKKCVDIK